MRYLYRFITYSLDGRGDNNGVVTKHDIFYLWCLREGQHYNLGCCFAFYFEKQTGKKNGVISGDSYITRLARNLGNFDGRITLEGFNSLLKMTALDVKTMINMDIVKQLGIRLTLVKQGGEEVKVGQAVQPELAYKQAAEHLIELRPMPVEQQPATQPDMAGTLGAAPPTEEEDMKPDINTQTTEEQHYDSLQYRQYKLEHELLKIWET